DGVAVVADDVGGEDGAVALAAAVRVPAGHVLVGDDGADAGHGPRVAGVDGHDARVRVRGAQDGRPQQALRPQVGGVGEGALGLGARVGGGQGGAEPVREGLRLGQVLRGPCGLRGGCLVRHAWPPSWPWGWSPGPGYADGSTPPAPGPAWCGMRASSDGGSASASVSGSGGAACASRSATTSWTASTTPR